MSIRKLISLYEEKYGYNAGKTFINFAYYDRDPETERLEFNGTSEEAYLTSEEFYELLKPALKTERKPTRRDLIKNGG